jgi:diguanylate cyclase (GGDEF)-like protein
VVDQAMMTNDPDIANLDANEAIRRARLEIKRANRTGARTLLIHARDRARARGNIAEESEALAVRATLEMRACDFETSAAFGEEALMLAGPFTNAKASSEACLTLCMVYSEIGLADEAMRMAEDARTFALRAGDDRLLSWSYTRIGDALALKQVLYGVPTLKQAMQNYRIARRLARKSDDEDPMIGALNNLARTMVSSPAYRHDSAPPLTRRHYALAAAAGERAMALTEGAARAQARKTVAANYGVVLFKVGRAAEGLRLLRETISTQRDTTTGCFDFDIMMLGLAEFEHGNRADGKALMQKALAHEDQNDFPSRLCGHYALIRLAEREGDHQAAVAQFDHLDRERQRHFVYQDKTRIAIDRRVRQLRDALWQAAYARAEADTDPLTTLMNRRGLPARLSMAVERAHLRNTPFAMAMIDIDYFKQINDEHGHLIGDQVLKRVAIALKNASGPDDIVSRYGGDEFVVGMAESSKTTLAQRCERMRQSIERLDVISLGLTKHISITVGVSDTTEAADVNALIHHADTRLYFAKRAGRNRVESDARVGAS